MRDFEERSSSFFRGLILGALIGAGAYYFLTSTEEGKKVKEKLKKQGENALDNLGEIVNELEEKGEEFKEKAKKLQKELEEKSKNVGGEIKEEVEEKLTEIESLRERGRKAARSFTRNGKPLA